MQLQESRGCDGGCDSGACVSTDQLQFVCRACELIAAELARNGTTLRHLLQPSARARDKLRERIQDCLLSDDEGE